MKDFNLPNQQLFMLKLAARYVKPQGSILYSTCTVTVSYTHLDVYKRQGHNEAVLKTVWVQAHVGSNPTLSAIFYI